MQALWQDVRVGAWMLLKILGFTLAVALTLGLGIGANVAVFSIVNTMLLRPMPVAEPSNLYVLATVHQENEDPHSVSWKDYQDVRARRDIFSELSAYSINFAGLNVDN